jgi:uncharacterized protein involved in type VI secretion and phage assembly
VSVPSSERQAVQDEEPEDESAERPVPLFAVSDPTSGYYEDEPWQEQEQEQEAEREAVRQAAEEARLRLEAERAAAAAAAAALAVEREAARAALVEAQSAVQKLAKISS